MHSKVLEKKKEAEKLVSLGLIRSSQVLSSGQSTDEVHSGMRALQQALLIYQEDDVRCLFPQESQKGEATVLFSLHYGHLNLGHSENAIAVLHQALSINQSLKDNGFEANTLKKLGLIHASLEQHDKAIECLNQSIVLYRIVDATDECDVLNHLGRVCHTAGLTKEAIWSYQQAIELGQQLGNTEIQLSPLNNLGEIYRLSKDYSQAINCYEKSTALAQKIGDFAQQAKCLQQLGTLHCKHNQAHRGLKYFHKALKVAREFTTGQINPVSKNDKHSYIKIPLRSDFEETLSLVVPILIDLGGAYSKLEQHSQAITTFQQAVAIAQEAENILTEIVCLVGLAAAYYNATQYIEAEGIYRQLLNLMPNHAEFYSKLATVLQVQERYEEAEEAYRTAIRLDPSNTTDHINLRLLLIGKGEDEEGKK